MTDVNARDKLNNALYKKIRNAGVENPALLLMKPTKQSSQWVFALDFWGFSFQPSHHITALVYGRFLSFVKCNARKPTE